MLNPILDCNKRSVVINFIVPHEHPVTTAKYLEAIFRTLQENPEWLRLVAQTEEGNQTLAKIQGHLANYTMSLRENESLLEAIRPLVAKKEGLPPEVIHLGQYAIPLATVEMTLFELMFMHQALEAVKASTSIQKMLHTHSHHSDMMGQLQAIIKERLIHGLLEG